MFTKMIKLDTRHFPKSWLLLQQEAILANSCIRTGFEFMVKGGYDDVIQRALLLFIFSTLHRNRKNYEVSYYFTSHGKP